MYFSDVSKMTMIAAILDLMPLDDTPDETPVSDPHVVCDSYEFCVTSSPLHVLMNGELIE